MNKKNRMPLFYFQRESNSPLSLRVFNALLGAAAVSCGLAFIFSSVVFAQGSTEGESESLGDSTWLYIGLIVLGIALIGAVLWMRSKSKTEETHSAGKTETTIKRAAARPQPHNKEMKTDDWLKNVSAETNGNKQNGAANQNGKETSAPKPAKKTTNGKLSALNYVDPKLIKAQAQQNSASASNGSTNSDKSWQLSQPGSFKPLPSGADNESILDALEQIREDEGDEAIRSLALRVLSASRTQESVEGLAQVALYDEVARLRIEAIMALGSFDHETVFEPLLLACADPSREVRAAAARALSRLSFNRSDAFVRVIGSRDTERLRLAALACLESGFAARAFDRLGSRDPNQSYEAFAILTLLVKADSFEPILNTIAEHQNLDVRLATVNALHNLNSNKMSPYLYELSQRQNLPEKVKSALSELLFHLETAV